ncbi:glycosyltransferase family 2 protein [Croceiramulus getboli]|nr:glycosyltransferase family 2 protein [Flavobacteriaceae bacterium YJPT1-3]
MQLSVIILNYQVRYFLEACLDSVFRAIHDMDAEVIVVDNHSMDDSCAMVREHFPQVRLIENTINLGFARANNRAVQQARGEYVCILNPDTLVTEDGFKELYAFAKAHQQTSSERPKEAQGDATPSGLGAVGPRLLDGSGSYLPESKRNVPTPRIALGKLLGYGQNYYAKQVDEQAVAKVAVQVGAYLWMERKHFIEMNGFDEAFFMYGEDIDLSYRLSQNGYSNYYHGGVTAIHFKGESTVPNADYYNRFYGAMQLFYQKHYKASAALNMGVTALVSLAKWVASIKKYSMPEKPVPRAIILVADSDSLMKPLESQFNQTVQRISWKACSGASFRRNLVIFDMESGSYRQLISTLDRLKNQENSYRLRPANCNFILGSDHARAQGEVILLEQ